MGVSNLVAAASGLASAVKSVQTGSAATAGTVTITSVNTSKCIVTSFPTGAAGTVSVSGGFNGQNIGLNGTSGSTFSPMNLSYYPNSGWTVTPYNSCSGAVGWGGGINKSNSLSCASNQNFAAITANNSKNQSGIYQPVNLNAANGSTSGGNLNGGSTNLYAASYGAYLTNSTTLTVTGPCQWQVVEYN